MGQNNVTRILPILDGKVLDGNVTSTISRLTGIDHFDGRIIVAVQDGRTRLAKIQLGKDCTKVQGSLAAETAARNSASVELVAVMD